MVRLDYMHKQLYSHMSFSSLQHFFYYVSTTLSMLLLREHVFNIVKITVVFGSSSYAKMYVIIRLFLGLSLWDTFIMWQLYFSRFLKSIFLIILEICYLLVRFNYVRKYDTNTLRVGSSFLDLIFWYVWITHGNNATIKCRFCSSLWRIFVTSQLRCSSVRCTYVFWWHLNYVVKLYYKMVIFSYVFNQNMTKKYVIIT